MTPDVFSPRRLVAFLQRSHLGRAAVVISALTLITKGIGAGREVAIARRFGVGPDVDAFIFAFTLVSTAASVLGGGIATSLIPAFVTVKRAEGARSARVLAGRVLNLFVLAVGGSALAVTALAPVLALTFQGEVASGSSVVAKLIVLLAGPAILAGSLSHYLGALLNADRYFAAAALSPVAIPLAMLIALVVSPGLRDIMILAGAAAIGFVGQLIILAFVSARRSVLPVLSWRARHSGAADVMRQCMPAALASVVLAANPVIDMMFAARLGPGSVSVLGYGSRVVAVFLSVLGYAFATVSLPHLSRLAAGGDIPGLQNACRHLAKASLLITVPITSLLVVASRPIVDLLYGGGAFTQSDVEVVGHVQALYVLHLPVFIIGLIFIRLINSLRGNRSLTIIAVSAVGVNVVADMVLGSWFGVAGIALSTSVVFTCTSLLAYLIARKLLAQHRLAEATPSVQLPDGADTAPVTVMD
jgi:putative peptidoglycan lipid II flippase